jgi:hypothetical protein
LVTVSIIIAVGITTVAAVVIFGGGRSTDFEFVVSAGAQMADVVPVISLLV